MGTLLHKQWLQNTTINLIQKYQKNNFTPHSNTIEQEIPKIVFETLFCALHALVLELSYFQCIWEGFVFPK